MTDDRTCIGRKCSFSAPYSEGEASNTLVTCRYKQTKQKRDYVVKIGSQCLIAEDIDSLEKTLKNRA